MTGETPNGSVACRFDLGINHGFIIVIALRVCSPKIRVIGYETNRVLFKEEGEPKTIFCALGVGDKAAMSDLELKFLLSAKKVPESELGPCD